MRNRYQIKQDIPEALRNLGFVAYVTDDQHPDDPTGGPLSMSWHQSLADAQRTAKAMEHSYPFPLLRGFAPMAGFRR